MTLCTIALGGNLGPVEKTFGAALERLESDDSTVTAVSSFHATAPVGAQAGATYLNAAAQVETSLPPLDFLTRLQSIESALGRTRELRWGPRTIDLDLLFYANEVFEIPRLIVPHPAAWYRRFVLDPLVEICPEFEHPVKRVTLRALRDRLLQRPLPVALSALERDKAGELAHVLADEFLEAVLSVWDDQKIGTGQTSPRDEPGDPVLIIWLGETGEGYPAFAELPELPRLDASRFGDPPLETLRALLRSALGA